MRNIFLFLVFVFSIIQSSLSLHASSGEAKDSMISKNTQRYEKLLLKSTKAYIWKLENIANESFPTSVKVLSDTPNSSLIPFMQTIYTGPCRPPYLCEFVMLDMNRDGQTDAIEVIAARKNIWQQLERLGNATSNNVPGTVITGPCHPPYLCDFIINSNLSMSATP